MSDSTPYPELIAELQRILAELESQQLDIDRVVTLVERSQAVIAECSRRIEQAAAAIAELDTDAEPPREIS